MKIRIPYKKQIDDTNTVSDRLGIKVANGTSKKASEFIAKGAKKFKRGY